MYYTSDVYTSDTCTHTNDAYTSDIAEWLNNVWQVIFTQQSDKVELDW